jgi:hypothetical protein
MSPSGQLNRKAPRVALGPEAAAAAAAAAKVLKQQSLATAEQEGA